MNNKINFSHFFKYLTRQPYFIYHDLERQNTNAYTLDEDSNFWELDDDEEDKSIISIKKRGFEIVSKVFQEYIINYCAENNLKLFINSEKTIELQISKTKIALSDPEVDVILYPVFQLDNASAKPTLYFKKEEKLSIMNFNVGTKLKDLLRCFYDYQIAIESTPDLKVENFSIFTLFKRRHKEAQEIDFYENFYANSTKTKRKITKVDSFVVTSPIIEETTKEKEETIFKKISSGILNDKIILGSITFYIREINLSYQCEDYSILEIDKDVTLFGENPYFLDIVSIEYPNFLAINGSLLRKSEIQNIIIDKNANFEDYFLEYPVTTNIYQNTKHIDKKLLKSIVDRIEESNVIWYDFEGFSMPFNILPYSQIYQQIVFQVSVIQTNKEKEIYKENLVIDPQIISCESFMNIIDTIYNKEAKHYVVYNKAYENTRLKEMLAIISENYGISSREYYSYEKKVDTIINNTIDLLEVFRSNSKTKMPIALIPELKGFSSIKKIEKYIFDNQIDLKEKIKPYPELDIQNGLMAMEAAINRFLGEYGDIKWNDTKNKLREYCENDVRAMIMVYYLIKEISK